jgi:alkanesulfonate monooxygenase SsuD/methylene tetrahydromethanopterin reductase-like flavin-dependent oxidoreductase (luciferase family)
MTAAIPDVSFGVSLSNRAVVIGKVRAIEIVEVAKMAEDSRLFDSAWVGDSIIAKPRLEAVAALSAIASRTDRIKLGTACLATFVMRHPVLFAHQWASLDAMSEGRSLLAVCLGGHGPQQLVEREFTTFNVPLKERVPRMLEGMEICRRLWAEEAVTHTGRFYQFQSVTIGPQPVQKPCPIWIANNPSPDNPEIMEKAYRRVATQADGWMTGSLPPGVFGERWRTIQGYRRDVKGTDAGFPSSIHLRANVNSDREAAFTEAKEFLDTYYSVNHRRDHLENECVIGTPEECIEKFTGYGRNGCNVIIIRLVSWKPQQQLERWITQVLPEVRRRLAAGR